MPRKTHTASRCQDHCSGFNEAAARCRGKQTGLTYSGRVPLTALQ